MTVYLDIVFLENICMNYIIIYATVILLKVNNKPIRIFLGSLIGAIYAVISVLKIFEIYNSIIVKILVSVLIIYVSTDSKNFKSLIKAVLVFYLVSFTFGGIALALLYFIKPENILMKNGIYIGTYPIKIVLLGGILGYILISIVYRIIKNKYSRRKKICDVEVSVCERKSVIRALIDSGNLLKEPITGFPVVVVEIECLREVIPRIILENIDKIIVGEMFFLENIDATKNIVDDSAEKDISMYFSKFRVIPFNSLGKENGLLLGIKADYLRIINTDSSNEKRIENVIIGLYTKRLSQKRRVQCSYRCGFGGIILN